MDVNSKNYYYKIEAQNSCNVSTIRSNEGSSILLQTELNDEHILLKWNAYDGWNSGVDYYVVEKQNEQGEWKVVGRVDGEKLIYMVE